jgi:hypothetical protein
LRDVARPLGRVIVRPTPSRWEFDTAWTAGAADRGAGCAYGCTPKLGRADGVAPPHTSGDVALAVVYMRARIAVRASRAWTMHDVAAHVVRQRTVGSTPRRSSSNTVIIVSNN